MSRRMIGFAMVAAAFAGASALLPACNVVVGAGDYKVATGCSVAAISDKLEPTVKACAMFFGCSPFVPSVSLSTCVTFNIPKLASYYTCGFSATSCQDIFDCRGAGDAKDGDCDGTSSSVRCEGNRAVMCRPDVRSGGYYFDCDVRGGTCSTYKNGPDDEVGCKVASCTGTSAEYKCSGNNLYQCIGDVGIGLNCAVSSATCTTKGAETSCFLNKPPCGDNSISCEGNTLNQCDQGSLLSFDCGGIGERCEKTETDANCLAPGCTLTDAQSCQETCEADGTTAILCVGGAKLRLDCTKYGFSKCQKYDPSASIKTPYVLCQQ